MTIAEVVDHIAWVKQYAFYGVQLCYPFITAFTAVGVAKVAFAIPWYIAFTIMVVGILGVGVVAFRVGLYSRDMDICWEKTPMAKTLCDRVERIENMIGEKHE